MRIFFQSTRMLTAKGTKPRTKNAQAREDNSKEHVEEKARDIKTKETERLEAEIIKVKAMKQGRAGKVFKMREVISGEKKSGKEAHAILDPKTNKMVVANEEIRKVTLQYCLNVLEKNKPEEEVKQLVELKEKVHELRMCFPTSSVHEKGCNVFYWRFYSVLNELVLTWYLRVQVL